MTKRLLILVSIFCMSIQIDAQVGTDEDAFYIKKIYDFTLSQSKCYSWLDTLSMQIGPRLSGSANNYQAIDYTADLLIEMGVDRVEKQECMVKNWKRNGKAQVTVISGPGNISDKDLKAISLGNTVGTGEIGVAGEVIEVFSLDTLDLMGSEMIKDKIVFFNRPMDPTQINTGHAYGKAVDQRVSGASRAGKYGAKAVLVRSVTTSYDDVPHTGVCYYSDSLIQIPAIALSTNDSELLSSSLAQGSVEVFIQNDCENLDDTLSYNVIGEIKGSTYPDEIILVGGHLDSWDVGGGSHDDGAGCVHSLQVFHTLLSLGYKPKRTLRCVMFNNEENGLGGGRAYAEASNKKNEFHLAAIESDSGGFTPRGFSCTSEDEVFTNYFKGLNNFGDILGGYDLYLKKGGGGADIGPLKSQKGLLIGFKPDNQRYFDFHHTEKDVIGAVNKRELELGAAAITSLVYLIDQYGLNE